jgi:predicted DNA-binding protein with PD1-like motif
MQYSTVQQGRTFVIRLEDGEVVHETIEAFAREHGIRAGSLIVVGGVDQGSRLVVGPENGRASPVVPMEHMLQAVHEVCGTGTLFPDEEGQPVLHMHIACGRQDQAVTGCVRRGVRVWHVLEAIMTELLDSPAIRATDPATGFKLLRPAG